MLATIDTALPAAVLTEDGGLTFDPRTGHLAVLHDGYAIPVPGTVTYLSSDFTLADFGDELTGTLRRVDTDKYGEDMFVRGHAYRDGYALYAFTVSRHARWIAEMIGRDRAQSAVFELPSWHRVNIGEVRG